MNQARKPFSEDEIDKLKFYLESFSEKDKAKSYEVFVDIMKVVDRTTDLDEFETFRTFMGPTTREIRFVVYASEGSPKNTQYIYEVGDRPGNISGLAGIPDAERINDFKLELQRKDFELNDLRKEVERLQGDIQEADDLLITLQAQLEAEKNGNRAGQVNMGEIAGAVLGGIIKTNPGVLKKFPGGEALAGLFMQDNGFAQSIPVSAASEAPPASFQYTGSEPCPEADAANNAFTKEQPNEMAKAWNHLASKARENVHETSMFKLLGIVNFLIEQQEQINTVYELLSDHAS